VEIGTLIVIAIKPTKRKRRRLLNLKNLRIVKNVFWIFSLKTWEAVLTGMAVTVFEFASEFIGCLCSTSTKGFVKRVISEILKTEKWINPIKNDIRAIPHHVRKKRNPKYPFEIIESNTVKISNQTTLL
jgi:hypothetical protein